MRVRCAKLKDRKLEDLAHEVGNKGLVSNLNTMELDDWESAKVCLYWVLNHPNYPYDKTVIDLFADLDVVIKGFGVICSI